MRNAQNPTPNAKKPGDMVKIRRTGKDNIVREYYIKTDPVSIAARIQLAGAEKAAREWRKITDSLGKPLKMLSSRERKELNERFIEHTQKWNERIRKQVQEFHQKQAVKEWT